MSSPLNLRGMVFLILLTIILGYTEDKNTFIASGCVCSGSILTYECTVMGGAGGVTVWSGTAFNCPRSEIVLLHSRFLLPGGAFGECNNGAIAGQSIRVEAENKSNRYTSQLSVLITPDVAGKTISCIYDNSSSNIVQSTTVIPGPGPLPPPSELYVMFGTAKLLNISKRVTFTWSSVAPECPAVHYNILASNCGSCPTTTNHTTVNCTDIPTDGSVCIFAVQTVVCGNITGNRSDLIRVNTGILHSTQNMGMYNSLYSDTNTAYIISINFLAIALIICIAVSILTVTAVILKRSKTNFKTTDGLQLANRAERISHAESLYEDVTDHSPSTIAIYAQNNVAYGL